MTDLRAIFRAGAVLRWHTNPELSTTQDRVDGHSARVARIILALHPNPSVSLLRAALVHDDGEHAVGDVRAPAKDDSGEMTRLLDKLEATAREQLWGTTIPLWDSQKLWLHFADRLDAYMWASHHAPHVLDGDGWPKARVRLLKWATALDCIAEVEPLLVRPVPRWRFWA